MIVPQSPALPELQSLDCLVVMGGPMSAWEEDRYRWLRAEKRLIESMIREDKPVLGICLGAQLVAQVLGARAYRGDIPEIGWFAVQATRESADHPVGRCLPDAFETFLWHADSFDLPEGAVHLARSTVFEHQAFAYGSALALQFHLEARPDWVGRIAARDARQLVPGPSVQGLERILSAPPAVYRDNNRLMDRLLDAWMGAARSGRAVPGPP
jgi:GMP synthase-like glutamine amidotransferase